MLTFPQNVEKALARLREHGFEAYVVGGAVRDMLRGVGAHDYDITTNALPQETREVFRSFRTVETGLAHGTLTVLFDGMPLEITTYRIDGSYTDMRHPDAVTFTRSLKEDAARRDFTVNAMAYHPKEGLKDFFGGKEDLEGKIIRAVGDPCLRFTEDALRILRAMRFASVLDFSVESGTAAAMREKKEGLLHVSPERIREELLKLLCGKAARRILTDFSDILSVILPEAAPLYGFDQRNRHHEFDLWEHTLCALEAAPSIPHMRLAALLHDFGKPSVFSTDEKGEGHFYGHAEKSTEIAGRILERLRFDNKTKDKVLLLIKYHDTLPDPHSRQFARFRSRFGEEFLTDWLTLIRADRTGQRRVLDREKEKVLREAENAARALLAKEERLDMKALKISGADLIERGIAPGKELGHMLSSALEAVLDGKVGNEKEALLKFLNL